MHLASTKELGRNVTREALKEIGHLVILV